ncbi:MAG: class IV adenylate cyclase [Thermodesulfovibrionales bacterium]|nr:class IV adenylate cyclase [Thermodesulfovibrionales bacterium]
MKNIEIKSPLLDKEEIIKRLKSVNASNPWNRIQTDIFYEVPEKDSWLKLRSEASQSDCLVSYRRASSNSGPRESEYYLCNVDGNIKNVLKHVLKEIVIVSKFRSYWHYKNTRIHLDTVDNLGNFIELETLTSQISIEEALKENKEIIELLGLDPNKFISIPYAGLLIGKK